MRRFALTNLRDFGMGKKACEDKITEECSYLVEVLKKWRGRRSWSHLSSRSCTTTLVCSLVLFQEKLSIRRSPSTTPSPTSSAPWCTAAGSTTTTPSSRPWWIEPTP